MSAAVRVASRLLAERAGLHLSRGLQERLAACVQREAQAREEIPSATSPGWPPTRRPSSGCSTA